MSKDKGQKNIKKAPATGDKKEVSRYQAGKKTIGSSDLKINKNK